MAGLADVLVPPNEEGTRATILRWCKASATASPRTSRWWNWRPTRSPSRFPRPPSGTLIEILKQANAEVSPDEVLARVSVDRRVGSGRRRSAAAPRRRSAAIAPGTAEIAAPDAQLLSPSVRRLLRGACDCRGRHHGHAAATAASPRRT